MIPHIPVAMRVESAVFSDPQVGSGGEFFNAVEKCLRGRCGEEGEIVVESLFVDGAVLVWVGEEGFDFGGESNPVVMD